MKKSIFFALVSLIALTSCSEADRVNHNIRNDANNFKIRRKVVALNTRTNEALFTVEGLISLENDTDGDLNVTIQTGEDEYKLFYAHLSSDVTYTCIQTEPADVTPYAYEISFFPAKEAIEHGIVDFNSTDEK